MKTRMIAAIAALGGCLSGCATIVQGTHEQIGVATTPSAAHCDMTRKNEKLGTIDATPGTITVSKTKDDILLTCNLVGYSPGSQYLHSGTANGVYGNIIAGGLIGWGVDSATGADNEYPASVSLTLVPAAPGSLPMPPNRPTS